MRWSSIAWFCFTIIVNYSGDAAPAEALARKIEASDGNGGYVRVLLILTGQMSALGQKAEEATAFGQLL